jgi:hypothetical protein
VNPVVSLVRRLSVGGSVSAAKGFAKSKSTPFSAGALREFAKAADQFGAKGGDAPQRSLVESKSSSAIGLAPKKEVGKAGRERPPTVAERGVGTVYASSPLIDSLMSSLGFGNKVKDDKGGSKREPARAKDEPRSAEHDLGSARHSQQEGQKRSALRPGAEELASEIPGSGDGGGGPVSGVLRIEGPARDLVERGAKVRRISGDKSDELALAAFFASMPAQTFYKHYPPEHIVAPNGQVLATHCTDPGDLAIRLSAEHREGHQGGCVVEENGKIVAYSFYKRNLVMRRTCGLSLRVGADCTDEGAIRALAAEALQSARDDGYRYARLEGDWSRYVQLVAPSAEAGDDGMVDDAMPGA